MMSMHLEIDEFEQKILLEMLKVIQFKLEVANRMLKLEAKIQNLK